MAEAIVLKKTRRQAVVIAVGTGVYFANLTSLLVNVQANSNTNGTVLQTLSSSAECTITDIIYSVDGTTNINRNGNTVFKMAAGEDNFSFSQAHGFVLNDQANANIQINFGSSNGSVILVLTKGPGFDEPNLQNLQDYQRP